MDTDSGRRADRSLRCAALLVLLLAAACGSDGGSGSAANSPATDDATAATTTNETGADDTATCTKVDWDISPGAFQGGVDLPPQLYGSYGPGQQQRWTQADGPHDPQGDIDEILGAPDGVQMIRWGEDSSLDGTTTVECSTGWGCFDDREDYGWENGIIFDLTPGTDAVFPHIWKMSTLDGTRLLEVWEVKITPEDDADEAITLLRQYIEEEIDAIPWDVFYISAPDMDGGIPTVDEDRWTCDAA